MMGNKFTLFASILVLFVAVLHAHAIPWNLVDESSIAGKGDHLGKRSEGRILETRRKHKKSKGKTKKHKHNKHKAGKANVFQGGNSLSGSSAVTSNPTDAFCKEFISRCYDVALQGKTQGRVQVIHSCQRNGDKYSKSYSFGCKVDGVVRTDDVLGSTEGGFTITVTTAGATETITATAVQETTLYSTSTHTLLTTETDKSTVTTTTTPITSLTHTTTSSTTITTASDVTATSVTTQTTTFSTVVTSTIATTTTTVVNAGGLGTLTLLQVAVPTSPPVAKRVTDVSQSDFCGEFASGCVSVCQERALSPAKHIVCREDSLSQRTGLAQYSLNCVCLNGKSETQHALAYAADQQHITTVSTVATRTVTTTLQPTETIPVEVLTTQTLVSKVTSTATLTSISTALVTSTIAATQTQTTPSTVATTRPTSIVSTTKTSVSQVTATSTTQVIIAPTGAVEVLDLFSGESYGLVGFSTDDSPFSGPVSSSAYTFMAIADEQGSDLYQLMLTDGSGNVWTNEARFGTGTGSDLMQGSQNYNLAEIAQGCNSDAPGPPSGEGPADGNPCETFIFKFDALDLTSPAPAFNLTGWWINSEDTTASQAKQYYWQLQEGDDVLTQTGDPVAANAYFSSFTNPNPLVYLRFPVNM